jgi:hypothetical protein
MVTLCMCCRCVGRSESLVDWSLTEVSLLVIQSCSLRLCVELQGGACASSPHVIPQRACYVGQRCAQHLHLQGVARALW